MNYLIDFILRLGQPFDDFRCLFNMKRKIYLIILTLGFSITCVAQQEPQYTMFWNNYGSFNPAYTSSIKSHNIVASLLHRNQWNSLIKTTNFNLDFPAVKISSGLGINYIRNITDFQKSDKINLNYSAQELLYWYKLKARIIPGVGIGVDRRSADYSKLKTSNNVNFCNDSTLKCKISETKLNLNVGILLVRKMFHFGIGTTKLNEAKFSNNFSNVRHYYISGGHRLELSISSYLFADFLYKTDLNYSTSELNLRAILANKFWMGTSYRYKTSVSLMAGVILLKNALNIGYSYDRFTRSIQVFGSAHEAILSYAF